jgi:hypothetical protein
MTRVQQPQDRREQLFHELARVRTGAHKPQRLVQHGG